MGYSPDARARSLVEGQTRAVGFVLALRQLARAPRIYTAPLGLLILPLGLFVFLAESNATNLTDGLDGLAAGTGIAARGVRFRFTCRSSIPSRPSGSSATVA